MKSKYYIILLTLLSVSSSSIPAADTLYDSRFKQWQAKANKGDAFAQYSLGNAYLRGNEVSISVDKALHWFQQAAKQNHAKSEYKLGYVYYTGKGVKRSNANAFEWFQKAANHSYSPAQFYLGKMYAKGQGTDQDYTKALEWLNKAVKNDYSPAKQEIKRIEKIQKNDTPVIRVATKKPAIKKRVKTKVIKKSGKRAFDTPALLAQGNWTLNNQASEILPSAINPCTTKNKSIDCKTIDLNRSDEYAEVNYKRESSLIKLASDGSFTINTRENVFFVLPADPDDPDVDPETIPATGLKLPQTMKCKFQNKNKIKCFTDDFERITFKRDI